MFKYDWEVHKSEIIYWIWALEIFKNANEMQQFTYGSIKSVSLPKEGFVEDKKRDYEWTPTHVLIAAPLVKSIYCKQ